MTGTESAPQHEEADADQYRYERKGSSQPVLVRQVDAWVGRSGGAGSRQPASVACRALSTADAVGKSTALVGRQNLASAEG